MNMPDRRPERVQLATRIMDASDEIDLIGLMRTLWRGKLWIALAIVAATFIGGYYAYRVAVPMYSSNATVVLQNRQESIVELEGVLSGLSGDQTTLNTETEVLRSRKLIKKLVHELELIKDPEFNKTLVEPNRYSLGSLKRLIAGLVLPSDEQTAASDDAILQATVDQVLKALSVSNIPKSYVFEITVLTSSAEKSALLANKLAELYILDQLEVKFSATEQATNWLTDRVADLKIDLEVAEAKVSAFDTRIELMSPEALEALNRQLKNQRDRVAEAIADADRFSARVTNLEKAERSGVLENMAVAASDGNLTRLLELVNQGRVASEVFIERFQQILRRTVLERDRAQNQVTALTMSVAELEQKIEAQSFDLVELQQLEREAEASRLIYEYFLNRLKETAVQQGIQQADSRVLSQAVVPTEPTSPRKSLILALSALLGLMAGSGFVYMRSMFHNSFLSAEDLEAETGYTVMGSIPVIPAKSRKELLDYVLKKPNSRAAESTRNLRTSLMLSNIDSPPRIVMSTSTLPSEGKTTQSLLLAVNMAALGRKVLLIEGDIRRRVFAEYFDIKEKKGLVSVLSGEARLEDIVQHDESLGIDILIGEQPKVNAADLFASGKFFSFLQAVRDTYDLVVIDTPPVLVVPDARVIGQHVDAILYTVKWNATPKPMVRAGLQMFESVDLQVTGLVLSQHNPKGATRYGSGGYGGSYSGGAYSGYYDN